MLINAIFEGGGIKGLAYVGVMRFLEKRGFRFNKVGGTSIGAVFASLIAAGYNSFELEEIINDFNLNIITAIRGNQASKIVNGIKHRGYYSLVNFEKYLASLHKAKNKTVFGDVKRGEEYLLKMICSDWKKRKQVVLPDGLIAYGYDPDCFPIAKAVAMSCSLPLVFRPYHLGEHLFLDGGVVNNFPITLFKDDEHPTLGFCLNDTSRQRGLLKYYQKKIFPEACEYDFSKYNIIRIDTLGIKSTDFREGLEKRMDLYISGYNSIRKYFYDQFKR
jgi:NTE family protein